jgi:hypothetical protein
VVTLKVVMAGRSPSSPSELASPVSRPTGVSANRATAVLTGGRGALVRVALCEFAVLVFRANHGEG